MGKILRISFKLNFTQNTLGCYGLITFKEGKYFETLPFWLKILRNFLHVLQAICGIFSTAGDIGRWNVVTTLSIETFDPKDFAQPIVSFSSR